MLTVKQAAQRLSISPSLMYSLISLGRIRHERYGRGRGTIRISEDALQEYRQSRTFGAADAVEFVPTTSAQPVRLKHLTLD